MRVSRSNPGAWFLLIVLSIQSIAPGFGGLLLCIGCDQTGFAIGPIQTANATAPTDSCCSDQRERLEDADETIGELIADTTVTACDCVRIELFDEATRLLVPRTDSNLGQMSLINTPTNAWSLVPHRESVCVRSPPDIPEDSVERTLLGQRTLFTI